MTRASLACGAAGSMANVHGAPADRLSFSILGPRACDRSHREPDRLATTRGWPPDDPAARGWRLVVSAAK